MRTALFYLSVIIIGIIALLVGYILLLIISGLFVNTKREYDHNSKFYRFLINSSTFLACFFVRIKLHVTGLEKIPENTRFLLVSNHTSKFDPILQWYVFRKYDIAYLSKKENFNVFTYGRLIRKCCFYAIDRENPANAARTLKKAEGLITRNECSVGIYPEGTRGDGTALLPFHNGVFYVARNTGVPIIVVATRGTIDIHRNFPRRRTDVYIDVVDVIPADFQKANRTTAIGARVRESLEKKLYQ